jgi:hypothetical protein
MKLERRYVMELKHKHFENKINCNERLISANGRVVSVELPENHHAEDKVKDVRLNVQINRIRKFKNVAANSTWYHEMLHQLIQKKIERKPLVMYLNGK